MSLYVHIETHIDYSFLKEIVRIFKKILAICSYEINKIINTIHFSKKKTNGIICMFNIRRILYSSGVHFQWRIFIS